MIALRRSALSCLTFGLGLACVVGFSEASEGSEVLSRQAIAGNLGGNDALEAFYSERDYAPLWTAGTEQSNARIAAFLEAADHARDHGLPAQRYGAEELRRALAEARTVAALGRVEAAFSKAFLAYAADIGSGVLNPSKVNGEIFRKAPRRDQRDLLERFERATPAGFIRELAPQTPEYVRLMREKLHLETVAAEGGWGPEVPDGKLERGMNGPAVLAMRNRLIAMGYAPRLPTATFDDALLVAVKRFQADHGLAQDGVVGPGTIGEMNRSPDERLQQIVVAMERERWTARPDTGRYIWVNIPDFTARIVDDGDVTFETRSVVGQDVSTHRTPEFSDLMEFMVVNPTWNVPRSITTREYLPKLQQNPNAVSHLKLIDKNGRAVDRASVNFAAYTRANFPYRLKEPPSDGNALGRVKFMFPNSHNIYLHDTPSKSLFARESRDFSHGCIRLGDPFDFARTLLARQSDSPEAFFQSRLNSGRENVVSLEQPVPVHIVYRTAFTDAGKDIQFRRDVYGRDGEIFEALLRAGVSLGAAGG